MNYPTFLKSYLTFYKRKIYTQRGRVDRITTYLENQKKINYMKDNFYLTDEALQKFEVAKEMEKQQIEDAYNKSKVHAWGDKPGGRLFSLEGEEYYNETYGK